MMVSRNLHAFIFLVSILICTSSSASVTIIGNRIIYPSEARSIDVQLKNNDKIPYVIQAWFDDGDVNSNPDQTSTTPFLVTPPVFRIQPFAGQIIRVIYNSQKKLPADRESIFWFNALEIPPTNINESTHQNTMVVMLRNRLKVFYRPDSLGRPSNILDGIKIEHIFDPAKGNGLIISNQQPWYASLVGVQINIGGKKSHARPEMISPFTKQTFWFPAMGKEIHNQGEVTLTAINDQGARISESYKLEAQ